MRCSLEEARRPNVTLPHGLDVAGNPVTFNRFNACALNKDGSMRLLANGAFKAICRPVLHAGEVIVVQSPTSIAGVGTNASKVVGAERWVVACSPAKKKSLFFTTRPPTTPPNWLGFPS